MRKDGLVTAPYNEKDGQNFFPELCQLKKDLNKRKKKKKQNHKKYSNNK